MPKFTGFPQGTLRFLRQLERNNDREGFAVNKPRYEALVREPALDFIATMGPKLLGISDHFVALPKKTGVISPARNRSSSHSSPAPSRGSTSSRRV